MLLSTAYAATPIRSSSSHQLDHLKHVCCPDGSTHSVVMNRRNPTRIEFKMDDAKELEVVKKEREESKGAKDVAVGTEQPPVSTPATTVPTSAPRTRATGLLERI